jgi:ABC-type oligopeptide transport system substrate-binding subunit
VTDIKLSVDAAGMWNSQLSLTPFILKMDAVVTAESVTVVCRDCKREYDAAAMDRKKRAESAEFEALQFLRRVVDEDCAVVPSSRCSQLEIAFAQRDNTFWVDPVTGCGFVLRPKAWLDRVNMSPRDSSRVGL